MIESEGYKAFRGTMRITPKCADREPFTEYADWLYKPEYDCWYGNGRSFIAEICEVVEDETNITHGHWINDGYCSGEYETLSYPTCSVCKKSVIDGLRYDYCPICGAKMDGEVK